MWLIYVSKSIDVRENEFADTPLYQAQVVLLSARGFSSLAQFSRINPRLIHC